MKRNEAADELLKGLPGEELVREGLADYESGRCTVAGCLVAMAAPRLRRAGLVSPVGSNRLGESESELELYRLLRQEGGDAYSQYNALVRELVSFEQALDRRLTRQKLKR